MENKKQKKFGSILYFWIYTKLLLYYIIILYYLSYSKKQLYSATVFKDKIIYCFH